MLSLGSKVEFLNGDPKESLTECKETEYRDTAAGRRVGAVLEFDRKGERRTSFYKYHRILYS